MNANEEIVMKVSVMAMSDAEQIERFKAAKDAKPHRTMSGVEYIKITY